MRAPLPARVAVLLASFALALLGSRRPARAEDVNTTVRAVLQDPRYRFCHEDDYPLAPDEHPWCPLVGDISGACPSLPKACKLPPVDRLLSLPFRSLGRSAPRHAKSGDVPVARPDVEDERARPRQWSCHGQDADLSAMSGVARVVFIAMIVIFVLAVARLVFTNLIRTKRDQEAAAPEAAKAAPEPPAATRGPVETDVERLLARARDAASRGDYARAVDDAYAALLRRLDGDGLIEIHTSRTNGDYVRALGERPELKAQVRSIVRDVEDVQFGATPASASVFQSVLARVAPIASRVAGVLLLLVGLGGVVSCDGDKGGDDAGFADTSPSGTRALIEVMAKHDVTVRRRTESLEKLDRPLALVVYPDAALDEPTWRHLLSWVDEQGGVLVLAGVMGLPPEVGQRIVDDADDAPATLTVARGVRWAGTSRYSLPPGRRVDVAAPPDDGGAIEGPRAVEGAVLLRGEAPVVTERAVGAGRIVIVADERLLMNAALVVDDDAAFVEGLLFRSASVGAAKEVELVDAWTGAGSASPIQSIDRANLTPFLVQLFVLVGLLFLWKGRAFSRLRDPPAETRRAFADHARALGMAYRRSRSSHHVAGLYAVWALDRLRERVQRSGRRGLIPLSEAIAARTGKTEGEVMSVLVEAVGARDEAAPPSSFRQAAQASAAPARSGDTTEADLALMRELGAYLTAAGSARAQPPPEPSPPKPAPPESRR